MSALLLCDNLFSPVQYPDVVLSASAEAEGHEIERFATLRREDTWAPDVFNTDAWARASHVQPRAIRMVCLWVQNLHGETYRLQISNDGFSSSIETIIDVVIPTEPGAGDVDDALGVLSEDGTMWFKRIPTRYAYDIRHFVPAMGADLRPEINGIVGVPFAFDRDRGDLVDANTARGEEHRSDRGVVGRGPLDIARDGPMPIKFTTLFEYEAFRFHLQRYDGTATGADIPALLIFDTTRAEQAVMVRRPLGRQGFRQASGYFYPSGDLQFAEHDAKGAG